VSRIFHVCADSGIAPDGTKGASVHLRNLASALAAGHELTLFTARPAKHPGEVGVPTVQFHDRRTLLSASKQSGRPDLIYERYSLGAAEGLAAARAFGCPFVLEVNAPLVHEARSHRPDTVRSDHAAVEAMLWREADLVVTVSTVMAQHLTTFRGDRPIVVVPNGCDPALFDIEPAPASNPTLGFLGHPKPWHGAEVLPEVVRRLRTRGHDAQLVVVGGGPGADRINELARRNGVEDHVCTTGALTQRDAVRALSTAWVGVAPYPADPFFYFSPIKIVEYLAAGLPVVTTDLGDNATLVGSAGILTPADDLDAFTDAVDQLLCDPPKRRRLGEHGRLRAQRELTWGAAADATMRAVRRIEGTNG